MVLATALGVVVVGVVQDHCPILQDEHVTAIGAAQDIGVEHQLGSADGDYPMVQGHHGAEVLGGRRQVMRGGDHGPAAVRLVGEQLHQVFLGRQVDAGDRFVKQVELRIGG